MSWVWIQDLQYYRRSERVDVRVVTEHVGRGRLTDLEAQRDAGTRWLRRLSEQALQPGC